MSNGVVQFAPSISHRHHHSTVQEQKSPAKTEIKAPSIRVEQAQFRPDHVSNALKGGDASTKEVAHHNTSKQHVCGGGCEHSHKHNAHKTDQPHAHTHTAELTKPLHHEHANQGHVCGGGCEHSHKHNAHTTDQPHAHTHTAELTQPLHHEHANQGHVCGGGCEHSHKHNAHKTDQPHTHTADPSENIHAKPSVLSGAGVSDIFSEMGVKPLSLIVSGPSLMDSQDAVIVLSSAPYQHTGVASIQTYTSNQTMLHQSSLASRSEISEQINAVISTVSEQVPQASQAATQAISNVATQAPKATQIVAQTIATVAQQAPQAAQAVAQAISNVATQEPKAIQIVDQAIATVAQHVPQATNTVAQAISNVATQAPKATQIVAQTIATVAQQAP
ncbi:hypothetical protein DID80_03625, partial [Candidatus Marinamargulisbacteria bacterium SCGC AAA071-K20]